MNWGGQFPFDDPDEDVLEDQIIEGIIDMSGPQWASISAEAKDLVNGLLNTDPKQRPTAAEALEHAWFTGHSKVRESPTRNSPPGILHRELPKGH